MNHDALLELLHSMSLEEKAGQLTQIPLSVCAGGISTPTGPMVSFNLTPEQTALCGSLICDQWGDAEVFARVVREMTEQQPHHIPPVLMRDMIRGTRTVFPIPLALGCTFDEAAAEECCRITAAEAAACGIHATFAPMVDVVRDPRWGRVLESPGESPTLCSAMGAAMVRGFRGKGPDQIDAVATCVKHFAAYGLCQAGMDYSPVDVSRAELYNVYLPPFKAALDAGCDMVMPSFVPVDRVPSVCSSFLQKDVLRTWWQSNAMTISDYEDLAQLLNHGMADNRKDAAELCMNAGLDMDMMSSSYLHDLPELVREGRITMQQVDDACLRVLELKNNLGLFERPVKNDDMAVQMEVCTRQAHRDAALATAIRSCVLLKNDGLLPLAPGLKVALTGDHADEHDLLGDWEGDGRLDETETLLSAFRRESRITLTTPEEADVILYAVGEDGKRESGEGASKAHPALKPAQMAELAALHALGKPVAMLVFCGRPLLVGDALPLCNAAMYAWFPGTMGAEAVRQLVMGDASPSGHLSMTVPRSVGQIPIHHDRLTTVRPPNASTYSNRYVDEEHTPLFPFGYGLSYTSFALAQKQVSASVLTAEAPAEVSVTVTNTGDCSGETVVQLYGRVAVGPVLRPQKLLIGWKRVALAAGESCTVTLPVTQQMLSVYDCDRRLIAPRGLCRLAIGLDSDAPLDLTIQAI